MSALQKFQEEGIGKWSAPFRATEERKLLHSDDAGATSEVT